jgi:4-diphosphocytidyl-2-C-methyl-D-erythritol kinase
MGAGLGGGSSNAVAALRALNQLAGRPLSAIRLAAMAARLGADCALFAAGEPLIMRDRGDRIERLSDAEAARLRGQRVLVFKPDFGIGTAWAYGRMAADPTRYLPAVEAEARLAAWRAEAVAPLESLAYNNMEAVAFAKFLALPALHAELFERFGVTARMSGSGSASFLILREDMDEEAIRDCVRTAWGAAAFVLTTAIV